MQHYPAGCSRRVKEAPTGEAFWMFAGLNADAVKIGMGIGSGCTTQEVKATGRGQATAIMEISAARNEFYKKTNNYIPLIADGGINTPADIAIALALGADSVMMGNFFARFSESPGEFLEINGEYVKEYWMEGSRKTRNVVDPGQRDTHASGTSILYTAELHSESERLYRIKSIGCYLHDQRDSARMVVLNPSSMNQN
jgi:IMP dehydrogenase